MNMQADMTWDPAHYLKHANHRVRPALDLLARIPLDAAQHIVDLGCGPGHVTALLQAKYPHAQVIGIDKSAEMLNVAKSEHGDLATWVQGDVATWAPDKPQDLIYSNAVLHWLNHHAILFPKLMGWVRPGGVLAVQMPNQFSEPSHVVLREVAQNGPWAKTLAPLLRADPVAEPGQYYDYVSALCSHVDIWETSYTQVMSGPDPVLDWITSTAMGPLRDALPDDLKGPFRQAVGDALSQAYPRREDGHTLFAFQRLFIIATRS